MKYTALDIVKRALNLADIANTDFLTHTEIVQYLNDAWTSVFQWLINKGDTQFVKEVELMNCQGFNGYVEYELPEDLYQIKSLKNKYTGSQVLRHADSESINSNTYEIVNDRLRLYGVAQNPLLLTYWFVPTFITFPDKDIEASEIYGEILSTASDSALIQNSDLSPATWMIKNLKTNELISTISAPDDYERVMLGKGHIVYVKDSHVIYIDYNGKELDDIDLSLTESTISLFQDSDYNVNYQYMEDSEWSAPYILRTAQLNKTFDNPFALEIYGYYLMGVTINGKFYIRIYDSSEDQYWDDIPVGNLDLYGLPFKVDNWNRKPAFITVSTTGKAYLFVINELEHTLELEDIDVKSFQTIGVIKYGLITTDGTYITVKSYYPDTIMNFPNEMYFSLLACDLALRFVMKANMDTTGLNNLYTNMQITFMNTLSQDGSYTRIRNAYN